MYRKIILRLRGRPTWGVVDDDDEIVHLPDPVDEWHSIAKGCFTQTDAEVFASWVDATVPQTIPQTVPQTVPITRTWV